MNKIQFIPPSSDSHFLVSGGGKGITAENAIALAKAFHASFTLIGRSALLDEESTWAVNLTDEAELKKSALGYFQAQGVKLTPKDMGREVKKVLSSREIHSTLDRIHQAGGTARYIQVDITDLEALENKISDLIPGINGILHGAGVLADKFIEDKQEADFDLVYGVKIGGLKNLLQLIPPEQLDYLVLFSSVAGFYGNAGQADYSISNEVLNKLAHFLKLTHPHCQTLSLGWGPWDGGMVTPQLKRILTKKNIPLISVAEGTGILVDLLSSQQENPQYVIGNPMPFPSRTIQEELKQYRLSRNLLLQFNPFLVDHVIGGKAVLPTVCAVAWFITSCEGLYPGYQFFAVRNYQVFKGIVFENGAPEDFLLELNEIEKNSESVVFEGKISSETPDGKLRYHYQAQVELRKIIPARPMIDNFNLSKDNSLSGQSLYESKVLFHGPRFQGIRKVLNISPSGLTTECNLDPFNSQDMGQFPANTFNPYMADVHLQSMLIWAHSQRQSIGLPLTIAGGIQYQSIPFGETSYATLRVKSSTAHKLVADVISHDQEGHIYTEVIDAEITLNNKLKDLFKNNQLEKKPVWK